MVATAGTIAQMQGSVAARPLLWDKLYPELIPSSPVTAVTVPGDRFARALYGVREHRGEDVRSIILASWL